MEHRGACGCESNTGEKSSFGKLIQDEAMKFQNSSAESSDSLYAAIRALTRKGRLQSNLQQFCDCDQHSQTVLLPCLLT
eukprot:scaffold7038_cov19-Tisochrysis_lutea.AAC.1